MVPPHQIHKLNFRRPGWWGYTWGLGWWCYTWGLARCLGCDDIDFMSRISILIKEAPKNSPHFFPHVSTQPKVTMNLEKGLTRR